MQQNEKLVKDVCFILALARRFLYQFPIDPKVESVFSYSHIRITNNSMSRRFRSSISLPPYVTFDWQAPKTAFAINQQKLCAHIEYQPLYSCLFFTLSHLYACFDNSLSVNWPARHMYTDTISRRSSLYDCERARVFFLPYQFVWFSFKLY